jgi:hypothetical protein
MKTRKFKIATAFLMAVIVSGSLTILGSCEKIEIRNFGFDTDFEKNSTGLTMMDVASHVNTLRLVGDITVDSGDIKVELIDPDGYLIYEAYFHAPGDYLVYESFKANRGIWKLRYSSLEGNGSLDLHLSYK